MRGRLFKWAVAGGAALALAACETPTHSNVLIFGTDTKIAVDVALDTTTTTPAVTIGYKRKEAVWMPLVPNVGTGTETTENTDTNGKVTSVTAKYGAKSGGLFGLLFSDQYTPAICDMSVEACKFQSTHYKSGTGKDTYSVLASFGADIKGGSTASGNLTTGSAKASGTGGTTTTVPGESGASDGGTPAARQNVEATAGIAIAQYFATGLAAQILADRGGAALVSVQKSNEVANAKLSDAVRSLVDNATKARIKMLEYVSDKKSAASGNVVGANAAKLACLPGLKATDFQAFDTKPIGEFDAYLKGFSEPDQIDLASCVPNE